MFIEFTVVISLLIKWCFFFFKIPSLKIGLILILIGVGWIMMDTQVLDVTALASAINQ